MLRSWHFPNCTSPWAKFPNCRYTEIMALLCKTYFWPKYWVGTYKGQCARIRDNWFFLEKISVPYTCAVLYLKNEYFLQNLNLLIPEKVQKLYFQGRPRSEIPSKSSFQGHQGHINFGKSTKSRYAQLWSNEELKNKA